MSAWKWCLSSVVALGLSAVAMAADFAAPPEAERDAVAKLIGHGARVQVNADYRVTYVILGGECSNDDLKLLAGCDKLTQVTISSSRINDAAVDDLIAMDKVTGLFITNSGLTDDGIAKLRAGLSRDRTLSITGRGPARGFGSGRTAPRGGPGGAAPGNAGAEGGGPGAGGPGGSRPGSAPTGFGNGAFGSTRGFGGVTVSRVTTLTRSAAVQDDLKLTAEQREQLIAATDLSAFTRGMEARVDAILTPEQRSRLKQLELQQLGFNAFQREEVATQLKLSDEQKSAVAAAISEASAALRAIPELRATRNGDPDAGATLTAIREKSNELRAKVDEKILQVMTEDQRKTWQQMIGPKGPVAATELGGSAGSFRSPATPATIRSIFDRYDTNSDGMLTEAEFPTTVFLRQTMSRPGNELTFPVTYEAFEKAYPQTSTGNRSRER
jgi:hypothetical protein